jgi:glycosyltransferase involved in cell wall biosynthesis
VSKVLIAIPAYNALESIDLTLTSCLNQSTPARILISDNSSTDGTYEHLLSNYSQYPNVSIIQTSSNIGRTGNWNFLLDEFLKYDETFIKFLFTGEELFKNCIECCDAVINLNDDIAAVAFQYVLNIGGSERVNSENLSGRINPEQVDRLNLIQGGFLGSVISNVYSKAAIGNNRFNPNYVGKTDFDFSVLSGRSAYYIDQPLAKSNISYRQTFHSAWDYWIESEGAFNRSYWLEREKSKLTHLEYKSARYKILADFVERNGSHYTFYEYSSILRIVLKILRLKFFEKIKTIFGLI